MEQTSPVGRHHYAGLDALRGIAAIMVVASHSLEFLGLPVPPHAALAVDFFFVLSGFVVEHAYGGRLRSGTLSPWRFAKIRIVRLHPLLIAGTLLALTLRVAQAARTAAPIDGAALALAAAMGILCLPWRSSLGEDIFPLNGPQWSLLIEYVANFVYAAVARWLTARRIVAIAAAGAAALYLILNRYGTIEIGWKRADWPMSQLRVIYSFAAGVLIARLHQAGALPAVRLPWLVNAALLSVILLSPALPGDAWWQYGCVILVFPAIVLLGRHDRFGASGRRMALWAGAISYPIYILHRPIVSAIARIGRDHDDAIRWGAFVATLVIAAIVAHFANRLDLMVRRRLDPRNRAA